jgi:hypothetical protein
LEVVVEAATAAGTLRARCGSLERPVADRRRSSENKKQFDESLFYYKLRSI